MGNWRCCWGWRAGRGMAWLQMGIVLLLLGGEECGVGAVRRSMREGNSRALLQGDLGGVGSVALRSNSGGGTAGDVWQDEEQEEVDPDAIPEEFSQLEGRPKSSFQFQWDGAGCRLDIPLSHGAANTKFRGQIASPIQADLTSVVSEESSPLSGKLEVSFPEKCPSDYSGLIALMQQGRFSADSEDVGVVHPTIRTKANIDGDHALDIAFSGLKVHFETSMPLQLFKGQFGVAFKIKMVEGVMVAKNSTFKYSASLQGMSTNGASSGSIKPKGGDVILSVPSLSYSFDTAQVFGSAAPIRLILTFVSNITAEFVAVVANSPQADDTPAQSSTGLTIYPREQNVPGQVTPSVQGVRRSNLPGNIPANPPNRQGQQGGLAGPGGPSHSQGGVGATPVARSIPAQRGSLPGTGPYALQPSQVINIPDEGSTSSPITSSGVVAAPSEKSEIGLYGKKDGLQTLGSKRLLLTVLILGSPVLLSFFLSIAMGVNAVIYLWEENSLKSPTVDCADSVSSISDESSESEVDLAAAGGNILWSTGDLSALQGNRSGNGLESTGFSMATAALNSTEDKDLSTKGVERKRGKGTIMGGPTLKNLLRTESNKGLTFKDIFCAVPEKSVFQKSFVQRKSTLEWKLLEKYSTLQMNKKGYKIILHHCTGSAQFGELTGVIGPEGSGKSTFLNLVSGRIKDLPRNAVVSGAIHGDKFPGQKVSEFSVACLPEDPLLPNILTVEEILINSAVLANATGNSRPTHAVRKHVGDIVEMLDLNSILQHSVRTRGSRISPLQKKKILIGKEFATMPDALILDGPVTGLDSRDTLEVMSSCRKIAKSGLIVMVGTRQLPSEAFHMLDRVSLLSRGRPVYHGLTKEMSTFFTSVGCPCPIETPLSQHAMKMISKPSSLVQILTAPQNPLKIENSAELSDFFIRKRLSRIRRQGTIELGLLDQVRPEPSDSPVAAHGLLETARECLGDSRDVKRVTDEQGLMGSQHEVGMQSEPISMPQPGPSGRGLSKNSMSRSPQTPGRIALETAILEDSVGQVSIPASGRARRWRSSITGVDLENITPRQDSGVDILGTAGSEFGDSVLEFDILSNPPTWRSGESTFRNLQVKEQAHAVTQQNEPEDGLTARSTLLYQRTMNPFDSGSDLGGNVTSTGGKANNAGPSNEEGDMDFPTGGAHELYGPSPAESGLQLKRDDDGRHIQASQGESSRMECVSPVPSSPVSLSPTASLTPSPYDDDEDDDDFCFGRGTPRLLDNKWPMAVSQGPQSNKADSAGDASCGSIAFDTGRRIRVTVTESKIPRPTDQLNDRPIIVQPGVSKIAKPQSGIQHGVGDDGLLCSDRQVKQRPTPTVPILDLARVPSLNLAQVPSLNLEAIFHPADPQHRGKSHAMEPSRGNPLEEFDTSMRTGRSSPSGIIPPVARGDITNRSIPSHRDQPFRMQPGTGVVSSSCSFDMFSMDWQGRSTSRSRSGSAFGGYGHESMSFQDADIEGTPRKIGNLDTSRSMAAYAQEVAAYAHEDIQRRDTEMSMMALAPPVPVRTKEYSNSIRGLERAPFRLELASVFIIAVREITRKRILLPLHLLIAAVLGLIMGILSHGLDDNIKGLSQRVTIFYSLLCLLTAATIALFRRATIETASIRTETRLLRYRPGSIVLVKACVENTCLRIAPVVVFAMFFLPLSGAQSGTLRFLLFVSGLSMFWISIAAALYAILAVLPFTVGRFIMTLQLSLHGPLICGFLVPRFRLWLLLKTMAMFSAFCNVFEILSLSELSWRTGDIVESAEAPDESKYKHAYPSRMGLEEDRMVQDALVSVGVYICILAVFWFALAVKARWGCKPQSK